MAAAYAIDFQSIFDRVPTPLMVMLPDLTILDMNRSYSDVVGQSRDKLVGRNLFEAFPGSADNARIVRESLRRVLSTGETDHLPVLHYPIAGIDGTAFGDKYWSCSHIAVKGASGGVSFVLQHVQDVTDVHAPELSSWKPSSNDREPLETCVLDGAEQIQALNSSLLAESSRLRALFMRAPSFMCLLRGPDHVFELANTAFVHLVGDRALVDLTLREALPEIAGQGYLDLLTQVYETGEPFIGKQMRAELERTPGEALDEVFIDFVFQPIFGANGKVAAIFVDGNDVTDHVRAERSQAMLVRELHHRVRNTLATVQGVMNSTARTAETIEDYQWAFSGRISSLARTHSLLTEEIQQFVSFAHLLRQEIGVYAEGADDRVLLEGPDVELPSQLAVPLGMTVHELATNAFRHGALSTPSGRVTVTWTIVPAKEKRILNCKWIESEGPLVSPPARLGFGSMILTRVLKQQIGARIEATYLPEGFELTAEIPLDIERA